LCAIAWVAKSVVMEDGERSHTVTIAFEGPVSPAGITFNIEAENLESMPGAGVDGEELAVVLVGTFSTVQFREPGIVFVVVSLDGNEVRRYPLAVVQG